MMRVIMLLCMYIACLIVFPAHGHAGFRAIDEDEYRDDFEDGKLDGWRVDQTKFRLHREGDNTVILLGGPTEAEIASSRLVVARTGKDWRNYAVECRVKKIRGEWAGVVFRTSEAGSYEVWLDRSNSVVVRLQPGARVIGRSQQQFAQNVYHTLRVAGIGPHIRVYVDGELALYVKDSTSLHGRCGLFGHFVHAHFDDFVQTRKLALRESLLITTASTDAPLVFKPGEPVSLSLKILNGALQEKGAELAWSLREPSGHVSRPSRTPIDLAARKGATANLDLGRLSEGLHLLSTELSIGDERIDSRAFPIAVVSPPQSDATVREPFFPVGVYDKYRLNADPVVANTYLHAICADLRRHCLNTIVSGGVLAVPTKEQLDITAQYGVRVILRVDRQLPDEVMNHPAILAYMFGDEPAMENLDAYKKRYDAVSERYPGKPILSCMVGESVGTGVKNDPLPIWKALSPSVRLARYYPIRKSVYNLIRRPVYKGWLPPVGVFRAIQCAGQSPWWYAPQTFGGVVSAETPEPYWRNPTGPELRAIIHLALAYGAKGIVCWCYQTHHAKNVALVKQETLAPEDDKYDALGEVARKMAKTKEALLKLRFGGFEPRCDRWEVEAVPQTTEEGEKYIYLVNRDATKEVSCKVTVRKMGLERVTNLFTGETLQIDEGTGIQTIPVTLKPGEGQLWRIE